MGTPETLCFRCGQPAGEPPRRNFLPTGEVCPACALRALEAVPPALPRPTIDEPHRVDASRKPRGELIEPEVWRRPDAPSPTPDARRPRGPRRFGEGLGPEDDRPIGA